VAQIHTDATTGSGSSTGPPGARGRRWWLIAAVAGAVIVLDQLTKWWAVTTLTTRVIDVVWTLRLQLARNQGAAFSLGSGSGFTRFLPLLVVGVVAVVIWQGRAALSAPGAVSLGLIVGGALGNLIDRALRTNGGAFFSGGVVDFIDLQWWPVFNVADAAVVCGGILLVVSSLWTERRVARRKGEPASGAGS
jgi:signal peptidase II